MRNKSPTRRSSAARDSIRAAATLHFARHGFHGASARDIAKDAGVPLSGIHYHFGTKQELFIAAFIDQFQSLTDERLRLLEEAQKNSPSPSVDAIIEAFILPLIHMAQKPEGSVYLRLQARLFEDQDLTRWLFRKHGQPATLPFLTALEKALPTVKRNDLYRGYRNMVFAVSFAPIDPFYEPVTKESAFPTGEGAVNHLRDQLVRFHAAGFNALAGSVSVPPRRARG